MDKKITVQIGGGPVVCNFGVNYFYKFAKQEAGIDYFSTTPNQAGRDPLDLTAALFYSGYLAEVALKRVDPVLTKADFEHLVMSLSMEESTKLLAEYSALMNGGGTEPGEGKSQDQPQTG